MKDVVAKTGEYQNNQGETKSEWTKVGVIMANDKGEYMLLDPAVSLSGVLTKQNALAAKQRAEGNDRAKGRTSVMCSIFDKSEQQPAQQQAPQQSAQPAGGGDLDDDIPFSNYDLRPLV